MSMSKVQSKHHYVIVFMYNSWREAAREQESTLDLDEFCESLSSEEKECSDIYETPLSLNTWVQLFKENANI